MFGYVKVSTPDLRVREHEFYKGTYCGLCHAMGKCTGNCSRMTLNYDFVFLALVRFILADEKISFKQSRCFVHPLKKRNTMNKNDSLTYCAQASAILTYQKIADDIADEKGFKRFKARLAMPFAAHARKKAIKKDPLLSALDKAVDERLKELSRIEQDENSGVDAPANCFGLLLGEIMSFGTEGDSKRIAFELGRNIGAWIYIADAIDDSPEDIKRGRYNSLLKLYGGRLPDARELELISIALKNHLYGAEAAFDLLSADDNEIKNIIQNILYLGLPDKINAIIKAQTCQANNKQGKET